MAENTGQSFEGALERDIKELELEIRKREGAEGGERQILKQSLGKRIYEGGVYDREDVPSGQGEAVSPILPSYMKNYSDEDKLKVEKLIDLAWHKGISAAVREARKEGAFTLDAFHDALTDKLYEEFKARGIIK